MSGLRVAVCDYLALRRALGYTLKDAEWLLADFVDYLEESGAAHVSAELALAWAQDSGHDARQASSLDRLTWLFVTVGTLLLALDASKLMGWRSPTVRRWTTVIMTVQLPPDGS